MRRHAALDPRRRRCAPCGIGKAVPRSRAWPDHDASRRGARCFAALAVTPYLWARVLAWAVASSASPTPPAEEPVIGAPSDLDLEGEADRRVALAEESRLHAEPDPHSPLVAVVEAAVVVPLIERRGEWVLVRYGGARGWAYAGGEPAAGRRGGLATAGPETGLLAAAGRTDERLASARRILDLDAPSGRLGPYLLYTDIGDRALLERLDRIAGHVGDAYAERFGVAATAEPGAAVLLFAREEDYRAYEGNESALAGLGLSGHATEELVALYHGERHAEDLAGLLVHELTHLLNRGVLGPRPAPWLEEGLANDLSFCRLEPSGRLRLGTLGGRSTATEWTERSGGQVRHYRHVALAGGRASLSLLRQRLAARALPPLPLLADLAWSELVASEDREVNYALAGFFVRYLLDGERGDLADDFRVFVASSGRAPSGAPADLPAALGRSWSDLQRGFERWLRAQAPPLW